MERTEMDLEGAPRPYLGGRHIPGREHDFPTPRSILKTGRTRANPRRYLRFRKECLDGLPMTHIAYLPDLEMNVAQDDNLERNALDLVEELENMLAVAPEQPFRDFLSNTSGWVDRYKISRREPPDPTSLLSHSLVVAGAERAANIVKDGFEQLRNVRVAHDQLLCDREARDRQVAGTRHALTCDRREVGENHFRNIDIILGRIDAMSDMKELRQKVELLREIMATEEKEHRALLDFLNGILQTKDKEFEELHAKQSENLLLLEKRMNEQYEALSDELDSRFRRVEWQAMAEIRDLQQENREEWESAQEKVHQRTVWHNQNLGGLSETLQDHRDLLRVLESESEAKQRAFKLDKIGQLQKLLQNLKAKCAAFAQVQQMESGNLARSDDTKRDSIRTNKRQIVNLYSNMLKLKDQYRDSQFSNLKTFHDRVNHYSGWCRKVEKLQAKCLNILTETASEYFHIWLTNEAEAQAIIRKLYAIDKVITEQQLCLEFKPYDESLLNNRGPPLTRREYKALTPYWTKRLHFTLSKSSSAATRHKLAQHEAAEEEDSEDDDSQESEIKLSNNTILEIFDKLGSELGFFIEERLSRVIEVVEDSKQARLVKMDKILGNLGLTTKRDISNFAAFFLSEMNDGMSGISSTAELLVDISEMSSSIDDKSNKLSDCYDNEKVVPLTLFLTRFREFIANNMTHEHDTKGRKRRSNAPSALANWEGRSFSRDSLYWQLVGQALSKDKIRLWERVLMDLTHYHSVLVRRAEHIKQFHQQNLLQHELHFLLNNYISSKENEGLVVPPQILQLKEHVQHLPQHIANLANIPRKSIKVASVKSGSQLAVEATQQREYN